MTEVTGRSVAATERIWYLEDLIKEKEKEIREWKAHARKWEDRAKSRNQALRRMTTIAKKEIK